MTRLKRFTIGCLTAILACTSLTGCNLSTNVYNKTMFSYAGMKVPLKHVWLEALSDIDTSSQYYGNTMWDEKYAEDEEGNDITFKEAIVRNAVVNVSDVYAFLSVRDDYNCELTETEKAEIIDVVSDYKTQFKEQLESTNITEEDLTESFTNNYVATKIYEEMSEEYRKEMDTSQYARKTYFDFCIGKTGYAVDGSEVNLTDDEIAANKKVIQNIYNKLEKGESVDSILEVNTNSDILYNSQEISIGKDNESSYEDKVVKAVSSLKKEGSFTEIIETDDYFHVLVAESLDDQDATEDAISLAINDKIIEEFLGSIEEEYGELDFDKDVDKSCVDEILKLFDMKVYSTDSTEETSEESSEVPVSNSTSAEEEE